MFMQLTISDVPCTPFSPATLIYLYFFLPLLFPASFRSGLPSLSLFQAYKRWGGYTTVPPDLRSSYAPPVPHLSKSRFLTHQSVPTPAPQDLARTEIQFALIQMVGIKGRSAADRTANNGAAAVIR